jgi:hypothetical protein
LRRTNDLYILMSAFYPIKIRPIRSVSGFIDMGNNDSFDAKTDSPELAEALAPATPKRLGALATPGFTLSDAFFEPLPEEELRLWEGEEE